MSDLHVTQGPRGCTDDDRWAEFQKAVECAANCSSIDTILNLPDFVIAQQVVAALRAGAK